MQNMCVELLLCRLRQAWNSKISKFDVFNYKVKVQIIYK